MTMQTDEETRTLNLPYLIELIQNEEAREEAWLTVTR